MYEFNGRGKPIGAFRERAHKRFICSHCGKSRTEDYCDSTCEYCDQQNDRVCEDCEHRSQEFSECPNL